MNAALDVKATKAEKPRFALTGNALFIDTDSSELDAYLYNSELTGRMYFVFFGEEVHLITLDDGDAPFDRVRSRNEEVMVMPVSDEDVQQFATPEDWAFAGMSGKNGIWQ